MKNVYFTARQKVYIFLMLKINHSEIFKTSLTETEEEDKCRTNTNQELENGNH